MNNPIKKWATNMQRYFTKDESIANKHVRRYSVSVATKEVQIKVMVRY